jgi:hypothetical protein
MHAMSRYMLVTLLSLVALAADIGRAQEAPAPAALVEFTSKEGGFKASLPGKPAYEKVELPGSKELQHQFVVGGPSGAYLISYQDNPNLKGATPEKIAEALALGRDTLLKGFTGKLVESKDVKLDKKHPGLAFRVTIPAAGGEARCRFYMVGTRLYQVMAIGLPAFAGSEEATKVLDSFAIVEK